MSKLNSKLQSTLNQWTRILDKEMSISEDLRKNEVVAQAEMMIERLKADMADNSRINLPF